MSKQEIPKLKVEQRDRLGTRYARRQRQAGRLPAVIYGQSQQPTHVTVDHVEITHLLAHHTHLLEVVDGRSTQPCLIKDVQWDHLGANIVHVDLTRVSLTDRVTVEVGLEFKGEAVGLKTPGALLERPVTQIEVECLATEIPTSIIVNVSNLDVDQTLTIADLVLPEGVTTSEDRQTIIASIIVQAEEPEEVAAEVVAEGAEPEVIRAKKPEEGEEVEEKAEKK